MANKKKIRKRFWWARLAFVLANAPLILYLQFYNEKLLVPYLVWMSWLTWLSSELPTGDKDE